MVADYGRNYAATGRQRLLQSGVATDTHGIVPKTKPFAAAVSCGGLPYLTDYQIPPRGFEPLSPP